MEDYKSFLDLDNKGSVLFIFSDRNNIFAIYEDMEDNCFFLFMMDKNFTIEATSEIKLPEELKGKHIDWTGWFRPFQTPTKSYYFNGICNVDGVSYKFKIDDASVMTLVGVESYRQDSSFNQLSCLEGIKIESHARKANILYVVGFDSKYKEQVYCVVDTDKDVCVKRYHLRSDEGDLKVNTVNVDTNERRVYLCGEVSRYNETDDSFLFSTPYVEMFLLDRG